MKKQLLSTLLVLCMVLALLPGTARAAATSGKCGDNVTWSYNDGTLTIQGAGNMYYYTADMEEPWSDYREQIHTVKIGDGVTSIGTRAFYDCRYLTSVTIPDSVTSIGVEAFYHCFSLTSATIPNSVTSIGESAFLGCSGLTSVTIPDNVTSIGKQAFAGGPSTINVASGNPAYSSIDGILFNAGQTLLHTYPSRKDSTSYSIPDSVTSIGGGAFSGCGRLTSITIPNSVTSIGEYAFSGCSSLTGVTIPNGVTSIGVQTFYWCSSLTSMTIPNGVTSIGGGAFAFCQSLTNVVIPDSVTSIGAQAFVDCRNLTSVTIPNGVQLIEGATFARCGNLTSVTIPRSVIYIGNQAFAGCTSLTDVYYGGNETDWSSINIYIADWIDQETDATNELLLNAAIHYNSTGSAPVPAAPGGISVTVGGKAVEWTDAAPFIDANSRTMVPLRAVADAMGLVVSWDDAVREAAFTDGSKTIYFPIDSSSARTGDGNPVQMDTAAVVVNGRTYAPIRYLAEFFGYEVGWDAATQTVRIK